MRSSNSVYVCFVLDVSNTGRERETQRLLRFSLKLGRAQIKSSIFIRKNLKSTSQTPPSPNCVYDSVFLQKFVCCVVCVDLRLNKTRIRFNTGRQKEVSLRNSVIVPFPSFWMMKKNNKQQRPQFSATPPLLPFILNTSMHLLPIQMFCSVFLLGSGFLPRQV